METDGAGSVSLACQARVATFPEPVWSNQRNMGLSLRLPGHCLYFSECSGAIHCPSDSQFCQLYKMSPPAQILWGEEGHSSWLLTGVCSSGASSPPLPSPRELAREGRQGRVWAALPKQLSGASGCLQGVPPGSGPFSCGCGPKCGWQGGLDLAASQQGPGIPAHRIPSRLDLVVGRFPSFLPKLPTTLEDSVACLSRPYSIQLKQGRLL